MTSVKDLKGFYDLYNALGNEKTGKFFTGKLKGLDVNQLHMVHQIAKRHLEDLNGVPSLPSSFSEAHSLISVAILSGARVEVNDRVDKLSNALSDTIFEYFKNHDPHTSRKFRRIERVREKFNGLKKIFRHRATDEYSHIEKRSDAVEYEAKKLEQKVHELSSEVCLPTDAGVYGEYPETDLLDEKRKAHIDDTIKKRRSLKKRIFERIKKVRPKLWTMVERLEGSLEKYLTLQNIHQKDEKQEWYLIQSELLKICSEDHDIGECPRLRRYINPSKWFKAQIGVYAALSPEMIMIYSFDLANKTKRKLS